MERSRTGSLRVRWIHSSAERSQNSTGSRVYETNMRLLRQRASHRYRVVLLVGLALACLVMASLMLIGTGPSKPVEWQHVSAEHKQKVHEYVHKVLEGECRPRGSRQKLLALLPASSQATQPFLWREKVFPDNLFQYPPPFGFRGLEGKVEDLLDQLPAESEPEESAGKCRRCVVVGNGGVLKGLELGPLINRFDTIIRLNSGPLGKFVADVGNRTSFRMSYPEGTPIHWGDTDPHTLFVAVVYKSVDLSWISAMVNKLAVPLWDWLFFWQKVPKEIPLDPQRFRLLNPLVIKETALDLLKYPLPRPLLWGWDQNVPTLGVSALNLASLLCDEVSLAGFGYNLPHQNVPLHYYDHQSIGVMQKQTMHNVDTETQFLQNLVKEHTITDLTGGIHCSFCSS
ncbi:lactosylceramide alpha-2,3-sialyltransferase isoform X2 [Oryzias melastigma]|uniref:Lactosylceramide alpha-2,3-sialyltransferase n=1 Tax=Oryzias melastigma TaxID=30732 RepID=A0A3B3CIJ9_ORYME|nr:lactosylceramide alpha-2,3-sialyltransferase isoform X2 [Oryzias melastigma]